MAIYLDTSALAKLYHLETGSEQMEDLLSGSDAVFLSRLGVLEMHSVFAGKVRTKSSPRRARIWLAGDFEPMSAEGVFEWSH